MPPSIVSSSGQDDATALQAVRGWHAMVKEQHERVQGLESELGATAGSPVKKVGSTILGAAAGVIDKIRAEGISKSIRDDYNRLQPGGHRLHHAPHYRRGAGRCPCRRLAERNLRGYLRGQKSSKGQGGRLGAGGGGRGGRTGRQKGQQTVSQQRVTEIASQECQCQDVPRSTR
jgi:hypothetical protein